MLLIFVPILALLGGISLARISPEEMVPGKTSFHVAALVSFLLAEILIVLQLTNGMKLVGLLPLVTAYFLRKKKIGLVVHALLTWFLASFVQTDLFILSFASLGVVFSVCFNASNFVVQTKKEWSFVRSGLMSAMRPYATCWIVFVMGLLIQNAVHQLV